MQGHSAGKQFLRFNILVFADNFENNLQKFILLSDKLNRKNDPYDAVERIAKGNISEHLDDLGKIQDFVS